MLHSQEGEPLYTWREFLLLGGVILVVGSFVLRLLFSMEISIVIMENGIVGENYLVFTGSQMAVGTCWIRMVCHCQDVGAYRN